MPPRKKKVTDSQKAPQVKDLTFVNFYEKVPDAPKYNNPNAELIGWTFPFNACFSGKADSKKTLTLLNYIQKLGNIERIYVMSPNCDEPLYAFLKKNFHGECTVTNNIDEIPQLEDIPMDNKIPTLFIFDDVVCADTKTQKKIGKLFISVRKKACSCVYISQSLFGIPKICRINSGYICLFHLTDANDISLIMKHYRYNGIDQKTLLKMYHSVVEWNKTHPINEFQWFWIDCNRYLYCMGFSYVFKINEKEPETHETMSDDSDG